MEGLSQIPVAGVLGASIPGIWMGRESKPQAPPEGVCFVEICVVLFAGGEDPAAERARVGVLRTWAGREKWLQRGVFLHLETVQGEG